ncbi:unnamed protein product, partial [Rotaria sp. Silwood1]
KTVTKTFNEDQAHGDDTHIELSKDQENLLELFSHENQQNAHSSQKRTDIPTMSNEYCPNMTMEVTDKPNEVLKLDNGNRMTQTYHDQKGNYNFKKSNK